MRPTERTIISTLAALTATICIASTLTGCSGARTARSQFQAQPGNQPGGNRLAAGQSFTFTGAIFNNRYSTPRFVVEKPFAESSFNAASSAVVTENNPLRGSIDSLSGVYTAPMRLRDVTGDGVPLKETITVVDQGRYQQLEGRLTNWRGEFIRRIAARLSVAQRGQVAAAFVGDTTYKGNADLPDMQDERSVGRWLLVVADYADRAVNGQAEFAYARDAVNTAFHETARLFSPRAQDITRPDFLDYVRPLQEDVLRSWDDTRQGDGVSHRANALGRLAAILRPDLDKNSVTYEIYHAVRVDPAETRVSIRDTIRLADYVTVSGDQQQYMGDGTAVRNASQLAAQGSVRFTFDIERRAEGVGGTVHRTTGVYTAPENLTVDAKGNLVKTGRATQDVIIVTSTADERQKARITVNVVTGDAPTTINFD